MNEDNSEQETMDELEGRAMKYLNGEIELNEAEVEQLLEGLERIEGSAKVPFIIMAINERRAREEARLARDTAEARVEEEKRARDAAEARAEEEKRGREERERISTLLFLKENRSVLLDRTSSAPNLSNAHDLAEIRPMTGFNKADGIFEILDRIVGQLSVDLVHFWTRGIYIPLSTTVRQVSCNSEVDAVEYFIRMLDAVVQGLGLEDRIEVGRNRYIGGIKMDVVLLYRCSSGGKSHFQIPFGIVEVKKPPEGQPEKAALYKPKIFNGSQVAGEHLDQLLSLNMFGYKRVFGMISTFNRCCLTSASNNEEGYLDIRKICDDMGNICEELKSRNDGKERETELPPRRHFEGGPTEQEQQRSDDRALQMSAWQRPRMEKDVVWSNSI